MHTQYRCSRRLENIATGFVFSAWICWSGFFADIYSPPHTHTPIVQLSKSDKGLRENAPCFDTWSNGSLYKTKYTIFFRTFIRVKDGMTL
jgi:hypothetical protein